VWHLLYKLEYLIGHFSTKSAKLLSSFLRTWSIFELVLYLYLYLLYILRVIVYSIRLLLPTVHVSSHCCTLLFHAWNVSIRTIISCGNSMPRIRGYSFMSKDIAIIYHFMCVPIVGCYHISYAKRHYCLGLHVIYRCHAWNGFYCTSFNMVSCRYHY
jgi:hypothetical protein